MPLATYRQAAERDLLFIAEYTRERWGEKQSDLYIADLEDCGEMLAANPRLGRGCGHIRAGLRRMEQGSHVIFYFETGKGVRVSRVLHKGMVPKRNMF
ncbi:MAG TPA: type II toxin-antitoxin system RelE/ParE family toxin [Acidobacteriaceae bacterium]|nr:type II toxin-antitoxin system RelE/ParE family toxin [Acidobacteriaceae bacterium]